MTKNIEAAAELYRTALHDARRVFAASKRQFVEPDGVKKLLEGARQKFAAGDERAAVTEVTNATTWVNGIAHKFLRGAVDFFEGRVTELSYMSLDRDIMDGICARVREYEDAVRQQQGLEILLSTYTDALKSIDGARAEQGRREEHRERLAHEAVARADQERQRRREEQKEQERANQLQRQQEAEEAAKKKRVDLFDQLFG